MPKICMSSSNSMTWLQAQHVTLTRRGESAEFGGFTVIICQWGGAFMKSTSPFDFADTVRVCMCELC